jgi:hypothetical protein
MKKKRELVIKINLSNRWLYTFIVVGILAIIGVGVLALTPGIAPNPGHLISELAPPSPCTAGQVLSFDGANWKCTTPASVCPSGTIIHYSDNGGDFFSGTSLTGDTRTAPPASDDTCNGDINTFGSPGCSMLETRARSSCKDWWKKILSSAPNDFIYQYTISTSECKVNVTAYCA